MKLPQKVYSFKKQLRKNTTPKIAKKKFRQITSRVIIFRYLKVLIRHRYNLKNTTSGSFITIEIITDESLYCRYIHQKNNYRIDKLLLFCSLKKLNRRNIVAVSKDSLLLINAMINFEYID